MAQQQQLSQPLRTTAYAAQSKGAELTPFTFERRALRDDDVAMEVLYCGVCHSDMHQVRNDWGGSIFPLVPGHELLDFCARKNILPDCELFGIQQINEAFERMERSDVRYRLVIDMVSLPTR